MGETVSKGETASGIVSLPRWEKGVRYLFSGARGSAWCFSILLGPVRKKR